NSRATLCPYTTLFRSSQGALSDQLSGELFEFQHTIREHGAPWDLWMGKVEQARSMFARLIGAATEEIAVVPSASAGAYQVASTRSEEHTSELQSRFDL